MSLSFVFDSLLIQAASGPNVFTYFAQSNFADLSKLRSQNQRYERLLSKESHLIALDPERPGKGSGPYYNIVREALEAFHRYGGDPADNHRATLRMGHVENALQRSVAEQIIRYEAKMVVLGSIVTGAPFLGLLGTVWGVMDAFGGMAGAGSASLQSLAPGVSGALLTTVAGLVVAIPSVFGYNYLLQQTKIAVVELENFASTAADRIELEAQASAQ
jgi:biopolymer transport protein TolQ